MRTLCLLFALCLFAVGCKTEGKAGPVAVGMIKPAALKTPVYGVPITPAGSDVVLIPFSVDLDRSKVAWDKAAPASAARSMETVSFLSRAPVTGTAGAVNWNNAILFDRATGESRLLLDRRAVVTRFYYPQPAPPQDVRLSDCGKAFPPLRAESISKIPYLKRLFTNASYEVPRLPPSMPSWPETLMLFGIADADTNGDGFIDAEDASAAYSCDLSAQTLTLTRLTPADEQFQSAAVEPGGMWIYLVTTANPTGTFGTENDGERDEVRYYALDASAPVKAAAMLPADLRERALKIVTHGN